MELANAMEGIVFSYLDSMLEKAEVCDCEQCRLDVAALTLNSLKPHYVVTAKGALFARITQMSNQSQLDVMAAIMQAVNTVKENPRHVRK